MTGKNRKSSSFQIKDCALASMATGLRAQNLKELKKNISEVESESLYYHFWAGLLQPRLGDPEYNNDFASWVRHTLHDKVLAERLGMIDPTEHPDLEELRERLIDILEERLDEVEYLSWCKIDEQFHFITSQIVIFDTENEIRKPAELTEIIPNMTSGSIFYHFIDSRRRTYGNIDDFSTWLYGFDGEFKDLIYQLSSIDPFFSSLTELRNQISEITNDYFRK
ncbi:MAG: hypothetical protein GF417_09725 [Candidatus Latescibacteria bacterium]|nr:hypothetical protein [bacterium]MBD3424704.1 hypothetical protein [Candidatus Latescibacterota bacterium]